MKDYDEKLYGENDEEILEGEIADPLADDLTDGLDLDFDDDLGDVDGDFAVSDDRIDRVLDEIAELKRNMASGSGTAPAAQNYAAPFPASGANTPSEVAMYNEISRLRDELSKTQHSQSMHMELNRMKEEMERETKSNEEKLLSEIKTLQKQIKSLQGEDDETAPEEPAPRAYASESDIGALIKINESLVNYTKAFCDKVEADIDKLKVSMPNMPALEELSAKLTALKEMPLSRPAAVAEPRKARAEAGRTVQTDMTEAMRRLIEIKLQLGRLNKDEYERELKTLSLYDTLTAAKSAVYSTVCGVAEKLDALRKLENELSVADDCYVYDIVVKYNELVDCLLSQQITQDGVEVFSRLMPGGKITSALSGETRAAATRFVGLVGEIGDRATGGAIDKLPEIVGLKNKLQGNRYVAENDALYDEVLTLNSDLVFINDAAAAEKCAADIKERIARVCRLPYGEFVTYPHLTYDKRPSVSAARSAAQEFVDEMLEGEEIKTSDEAIGALTSAVNLLRAEIADGAMLSGEAVEASALRDLMSDVEHIKAAVDSLVGEDVDALVETENEDISKLLAEVKTLHTEVNTLSESSPQAGSGVSTPDEVNLFLSEIVSLRDEVQSYKDEISGLIDRIGAVPESGASFVPTSENADNTGAMILDELTGIRADIAGYTDELEAVRTAVEELRSGDALRAVVSADGTVLAASAADGAAVLAELDEIKKILNDLPLGGDGDKLLAVRDELLGAVNGIKAAAGGDEENFNEIRAEIESVKQQLSDLQLYETVGSQSDGSAAVLEEIASLRDMVADVASAPAQAVDIAPVTAELASLKNSLTALAPAGTEEIKDELAALRAELGTVGVADIDVLRGELASLKKLVLDRTYDREGAAIRDIRESVHKMIDEPDYSVMNEILALREEFQLMKERIEKSALLSGGNAGSKLADEVRELRAMLSEALGRESTNAAAEIAVLQATVAEQREVQESMLVMMRSLLEKQERIEAKLGSVKPERKEEKKERDDEVKKELENIKYTLSVLQGNDDKDADADLEASIGKLKAELSQMAGIVEEDRKAAAAARKKKAAKAPDTSDAE